MRMSLGPAVEVDRETGARHDVAALTAHNPLAARRPPATLPSHDSIMWFPWQPRNALNYTRLLLSPLNVTLATSALELRGSAVGEDTSTYVFVNIRPDLYIKYI